jgi:Uma2 family endonuclease
MLTIDGGRATVPSGIFDHDGFRAWARSGDVSEGVRVAFIQGEVLLEMSPESTESHSKPKGTITSALWRIVDERDAGEAYPDRVLLTNVEAELSTEPDFVFASWEAFESGRLRLVTKSNRQDDYVELEGTPDLVVEIISDASVRKDEELLRRAYHRAGVPEYWLIDARYELSFVILHHTSDGYVPGAPNGEPQPSRVLGLRFELARATNRLGRWRYSLTTV